MQDYPSVKLQALDKGTARTSTFEARVGATVQYGPLYIKVRACRKAPPIDPPESAAFLQIWEVNNKTQEPEWIFSGWMFASSPSLSAMDHPLYDVWVLDCTGEAPEEEQIPSEEAIEVPAIEGAVLPPENKNADETDGVLDDKTMIQTPTLPAEDQQLPAVY
ncbi:MAG: DUF2155 domain-containing protein [Rhodospirillales bacterium]|nr:DUF2155 domain-containing protein [Rhodospirillales bacterium]